MPYVGSVMLMAKNLGVKLGSEGASGSVSVIAGEAYKKHEIEVNHKKNLELYKGELVLQGEKVTKTIPTVRSKLEELHVTLFGVCRDGLGACSQKMQCLTAAKKEPSLQFETRVEGSTFCKDIHLQGKDIIVGCCFLN